MANLGEGPETFYARRERLKEKGYNGNGAGVPLAIAAQAGPEWRTWPTPTARDWKDTGDLSNVPENSLLPRVVQRVERERNWPTPTARLGQARGAQAKRYEDPARSNDLDDAVAARDRPGQLNPTWVEWLMGFPLGWTVCDASATRSSRRSRNGSEPA